jgi:hypothetical protein
VLGDESPLLSFLLLPVLFAFSLSLSHSHTHTHRSRYLPQHRVLKHLHYNRFFRQDVKFYPCTRKKQKFGVHILVFIFSCGQREDGAV